MPRPDALDRTLELPAEAVDDLDPLESTTAGPTEPRAARNQTVSLPPSLDRSSGSHSGDLQGERELASRRLSIARREQRHRHAMEMEELRHRHESRRQRKTLEERIMLAVLLLVVASGLAWIALPQTDAAQIVFTTTFGAMAGYLGGRSRLIGRSR